MVSHLTLAQSGFRVCAAIDAQPAPRGHAATIISAARCCCGSRETTCGKKEGVQIVKIAVLASAFGGWAWDCHRHSTLTKNSARWLGLSFDTSGVANAPNGSIAMAQQLMVVLVLGPLDDQV